jgi:hypothetical protein
MIRPGDQIAATGWTGTRSVATTSPRPDRATVHAVAPSASPPPSVMCLQLFTMKGNEASDRVAAKAGFHVVEVIHDKDLGCKRATVSRWERCDEPRADDT